MKRAKAEGYRGRAAYKIMELDDKFKFLKPGSRWLIWDVLQAVGVRLYPKE